MQSFVSLFLSRTMQSFVSLFLSGSEPTGCNYLGSTGHKSCGTSLSKKKIYKPCFYLQPQGLSETEDHRPFPPYHPGPLIVVIPPAPQYQVKKRAYFVTWTIVTLNPCNVACSLLNNTHQAITSHFSVWVLWIAKYCSKSISKFRSTSRDDHQSMSLEPMRWSTKSFANHL